MNTAALIHASRPPLAYPLGEKSLRVVLKAARGDLAGATCVYGDRYGWAPDRDEAQPMALLGEDSLHEYWGATLEAPTRRIRYALYALGKSGDSAWLTEQGLSPRRPWGGFFQYGYLHRADVMAQPPWLREAVFYAIFPDRFANGDRTNDPAECMAWGDRPGFASVAGGDITGIRQKLDYLQDLGVNVLYTTPIFAAPTNHKYDTSDYFRVDPAFGTNAEFKELVDEVHRRGMRFLLDAVFNHAGSQWFAFADVLARGKESPYAGWFFDIRSFPVDPYACNYETFGNGIASMPKLNTANPDLQRYLLGVAAYWLAHAGTDGWRLDVANEVDHGFWRTFRAQVKSVRPDAFILGEVWHEALPWLQGDQFDSVMNYPWREATLGFLKGEMDALEYDRALTRLRFAYPHEAVRGLVNLLGSHDTARVRTELGGREKAAQAAVLLMTAEGVPMIYYGDEVGLEGGRDPDCRRCYPWDDPSQQDLELLALYRRLTALRRRFPWLNDGDHRRFLADPVRGLYGFRRLSTPLVAPNRPVNEEGLLVIINNSGRQTQVAVPGSGPLENLLAGEMQAGSLRDRTIHLPARGFAVLHEPHGQRRVTMRSMS